MDSMDLSQYMKDGKGRLWPPETVPELDKVKDEMVRRIIEKSKTIQGEMVKFKKETYAEITAFMDLAAAEYDKTYGGKKGNLKFSSFNQKMAIQVQIQDDLTCDEKIWIAKELIDSLLDRWTVDGKKEIRTLVTDAFDVNQEGKLNIGKILSLRRHRFDDSDWIKAMDIISDSIQVVGSKSYFRAYERTGQENSMQCITLDFSKL